MQDQQIEIAAAELYDPAMPYHNFNHARYVAGEAARIVDKCRTEHVAIDADTVYYAALFHDAGYHWDHMESGFETKEAYAAYLAEKPLREAGIGEETLAKVRDAILATHYAAHCASNEARAVRAADLSGLAADYPVFKENAEKLRIEQEMLGGDKIKWSAWKQRVRDNVELYLHEDLHLTRDYFDENGESIFHKRAHANLEQLLADTSAPA